MSSSRRTMAPDDGILASLERGSNSSQMQRSWLVFGVTVAILLTAMVAWLAYNNATSVRALSVEVHPEPQALAAGAASGIPAAPPDTTDAPELRQAAAIVDVPDAAAAAPAAAAVPAAVAPAAAPAVRPPLVMLAPEQGGAAPAPVARPAPREEIAQAAAPAPAAAAPAPAKAAPRALAARSAAKAAPRQAAAPAAAPKARPAPKPARSLASRPPASATPKKTGRGVAATAKPKARTPEVVDSDVALLSAIVAHASHHAAERARQEACTSGKKCPDKPPVQP